MSVRSQGSGSFWGENSEWKGVRDVCGVSVMFYFLMPVNQLYLAHENSSSLRYVYFSVWIFYFSSIKNLGFVSSLPEVNGKLGKLGKFGTWASFYQTTC